MAKILLNKNNFLHNLRLCAKQAHGKSKVAIVLKDNAYGHGLEEVSQIACEFGLTKAVAKTFDDALRIKKYFSYILILKVPQKITYSHNFHIVINSLCEIEQLPKQSNIHIKIDTGMHRNGIMPNELCTAIYRALERNLNITGIFTHYKNADSIGGEYYWQKTVFKGIKKKTKKICEKLNIAIPKFHSCNSSALFRENFFNEDMCRIGLACYGYMYNHNIKNKINLKPVLSLWANKISSKNLTKGQSIGYGGGYTVLNDAIISTYDIGYGDGFFRINEYQSYKTRDGFFILGRVSMDSLSLQCKLDEVCLFENVYSLAELHNTIYYEILTSLKEYITRKWI